MEMKRLISALAGLGTAAFVGCSAGAGNHVSESAGLLEFLADRNGGSGRKIPVKLVDGSEKWIATARARIYSDTSDVMVSGSGSPDLDRWRGDHVDVTMIGPDGRMIDGASTDFIHFGNKRRYSGLSRSRFAVGLSGSPPEGSSVSIAFHAGRASRCNKFKR